MTYRDLLNDGYSLSISEYDNIPYSKLAFDKEVDFGIIDIDKKVINGMPIAPDINFKKFTIRYQIIPNNFFYNDIHQEPVLDVVLSAKYKDINKQKVKIKRDLYGVADTVELKEFILFSPFAFSEIYSNICSNIYNFSVVENNFECTIRAIGYNSYNEKVTFELKWLLDGFDNSMVKYTGMYVYCNDKVAVTIQCCPWNNLYTIEDLVVFLEEVVGLNPEYLSSNVPVENIVEN